MMTAYPYTKASVNSDKLSLEIEADETIVTDLLSIGWDAPDDLTITFDGTLSTEEETALDTIVTNHDGNPPNSYEPFCYPCGKFRPTIGLTPPTQCPVCSSTDIQNQFQKINLAGTSPVDSDVSGWADGNMGIGIGTDDSVWMMYKKGTAVKSVQLT